MLGAVSKLGKGRKPDAKEEAGTKRHLGWFDEHRAVYRKMWRRGRDDVLAWLLSEWRRWVLTLGAEGQDTKGQNSKRIPSTSFRRKSRKSKPLSQQTSRSIERRSKNGHDSKKPIVSSRRRLPAQAAREERRGVRGSSSCHGQDGRGSVSRSVLSKKADRLKVEPVRSGEETCS